MAHRDYCVEVMRRGSTFFLLDTKGYLHTEGGSYNPLLATLDEHDYDTRLAEITTSERGDAGVMFDVAPTTLGPAELHAFVAYAAAGRLACIGDGESVIARERMPELTTSERSVPSIHSV